MHFLQKLARMITKQYNLTVHFQGDRACTDGKNIYLPYYKEVTEELKNDLLAFTHHECGHCLYTDFEVVRKNKSAAVHHLSNIMEDVRIEALMSEAYPGAAFTLRSFNEKTYGLYAKKDWSKTPILERVFCGIFFTAIGMANLDFLMLDSTWSDFVKKVAARVNTLTSTAEIMAYAKELVDLLNIPEPKANQTLKELMLQGLKDAIKNAAKANSLDSKSTHQGETLSEEELLALEAALSELSEDEIKKLKEMAGEQTGQKISSFNEKNNPTMDAQGEAKFKEHREKEEKLESTKNTVNSWKNSFSNETHSIPVTTQFDKELDFTKTTKSPAFIELLQKLKPLINPIREKLERVLIAPNRPHWKTNEPRGRINTRVLGLANIPNNAFKVVERTTPEAAAVSILIDLSGSMQGEKTKVAQETALALALVLELLKIPFEILGFNDHSSNHISNFAREKADLHRYNRTSSILHKHIFKSFSSNNLFGITEMKSGGANPDGECVSWAADRLIDRNEKKKILMVLSDGQPASFGENNEILCSDLKRRIKELSKTMDIIGLGIQSNSVADFYPNHVIINTLDDLPGRAVSQMVQMLTK